MTNRDRLHQGALYDRLAEMNDRLSRYAAENDVEEAPCIMHALGETRAGRGCLAQESCGACIRQYLAEEVDDRAED